MNRPYIDTKVYGVPEIATLVLIIVACTVFPLWYIVDSAKRSKQVGQWRQECVYGNMEACRKCASKGDEVCSRLLAGVKQ